MRIWLVERNLPEWKPKKWRPWGLFHIAKVDAVVERDLHKVEHPTWRFRVRAYHRAAEVR